MTILITLANTERTGAPKMGFQYARAMVEAGHRVLAACGPSPETTSSIIPDLAAGGAEIQRFPAFDRRNLATVTRRLVTLVRNEEVTCLVGFLQRDRAIACLVAGLTGTRCVISAQNQHVFRGGWLDRWTKEQIYRWTVGARADLVVCSSAVVEQEIRDRFGVNGNRTTVLPNGIDVRGFPTFEPEKARRTRRDMGVSDEERLLLNVGRIDRQKGQDILLRAFGPIADRYPRTRLGLVGAAGWSSASDEALQYGDRLQATVRDRDLEDRVDFLGWRDDVPRLLAAADIYVHAARWEGPALCLSVLEAMAASLPVISTDCSGRPQGFVDGEHGWIVPTGDVGALTEALERVLSMSARDLGAMGARARALAERNYDIRRIGERFVALVEEVTAP